MSRTKCWTVEILIEEGDGRTHAVARLDTSDDAHVHGHGACHDDPIGRAGADALAVAAALQEVAAKLAGKASAGAQGTRLAPTG